MARAKLQIARGAILIGRSFNGVDRYYLFFQLLSHKLNLITAPFKCVISMMAHGQLKMAAEHMYADLLVANVLNGTG
jgi:hypothetical protein